jgi:thiamine monophosphate synthase
LECQARSDRPVFVTGGVTAENVATLVESGLRHFVVVRALTQSATPQASARALRRALDDALSAVAIEPT